MWTNQAVRSFEESRVIHCPAAAMFAVVMDIESYPDFLPWVAGASVLSREEGELTAELVAELAGTHHTFRTVDRYVTNKLVEIRLLDGPFRFLESVWTFAPQGEHDCMVHFSIEFEFRSMMLDMVASPIFSTACKSMVQGFERRIMELS